MSINFYNEDISFPYIKKRITISWIKSTVLFEGKSTGDISIIFCSDNYLLEVNKTYLNHDYFTDVITFDYVEGNVINGDIFISVDRITENANVYNISFLDELNRVIIHGILHLLGYKDKSKVDKLLMTEKEDFFLKRLNIN